MTLITSTITKKKKQRKKYLKALNLWFKFFDPRIILVNSLHIKNKKTYSPLHARFVFFDSRGNYIILLCKKDEKYNYTLEQIFNN